MQVRIGYDCMAIAIRIGDACGTNWITHLTLGLVLFINLPASDAGPALPSEVAGLSKLAFLTYQSDGYTERGCAAVEQADL
jgi:hypothetical protein